MRKVDGTTITVTDLLGYFPERRTARTLYTAEELGAIIVRERARTDRTGRPFCTVVFDVAKTGSRMYVRDLYRLQSLLEQRLRWLDDIGYLEEDALCVVLPETSADAAQKLTSEIISRAADDEIALRARVYVYPSAGSTTTPTSSSGGQPADDTPVPSAPAAPAESAVTPAASVPVESLRGFLAQGMPEAKKAMDVVVSLLAIIISSPVMIVAALAVKLTSPGPIVFRQIRVGRGGRPFTIYKFRSMYIDAEARKRDLMKQNEVDGPVFKIKNDPRVTPVGRIIRKLSIDELPQLFNVLNGDMSLIGPRPPVPSETAEYQLWQWRRLDVTPGLTCIWQVYGRSRVSFNTWMRMDIEYIRRRGLAHDLSLLISTVPAILFGRGAH